MYEVPPHHSHSSLASACLAGFNVGVAWFTKQPRPYHLCTPDVQRAWEKLAGEEPSKQEWACN